jgi:hypothetical protein
MSVYAHIECMPMNYKHIMYVHASKVVLVSRILTCIYVASCCILTCMHVAACCILTCMHVAACCSGELQDIQGVSGVRLQRDAHQGSSGHHTGDVAGRLVEDLKVQALQFQCYGTGMRACCCMRSHIHIIICAYA